MRGKAPGMARPLLLPALALTALALPLSPAMAGGPVDLFGAALIDCVGTFAAVGSGPLPTRWTLVVRAVLAGAPALGDNVRTWTWSEVGRTFEYHGTIAGWLAFYREVTLWADGDLLAAFSCGVPPPDAQSSGAPRPGAHAGTSTWPEPSTT